MNNGENLDNVVEINSYSTFGEDGKAYAGIDVDSNQEMQNQEIKQHMKMIQTLAHHYN